MGASEQLLLAASFNLIAAVVFLGGFTLAIIYMRRANRDRKALIDRLWNINSEVMEQSAANANLESYAYRQAQKRKVAQGERAILKKQAESTEPDPFEGGAD